MQTTTYAVGDPVKIRAHRADAPIGDYSPDTYDYLDDVVTTVGTKIVRTKRYPNGFRIEGGHRNDDRRPEAKILSLDEYNTRARVTDASHRLRDLNVSVYHGKYTADTLEQVLALLEAAPENRKPTSAAA